MSNATLDRPVIELDGPETDVTPFTLFWAEDASTDVTSESEWFFSEPTQGLTSISATSQDKWFGTPPPGTNPDGDGGDIMSRGG